MHQTTTMNQTLIIKDVSTTKKSEAKIACSLVIVLCLLGLTAAVFTNPMILLIGLAGFCVLAAIVFHATFLIAMLRPSPKKFDGVKIQ